MLIGDTMKNIYKCPYCGQTEYAKNSKKFGMFLSWIAVIYHTPKCAKNNGEYAITEEYGPIYYKEFLQPLYVLKNKYPNITFKKYLKQFKSKGLIDKKFTHIIVYSKKDIIEFIQRFYRLNDKIPQLRDFQENNKYPSYKTVQKYFGSWNNGIEAAGFESNIQNGYGIDTYGKDGNLYRSIAEAHFVDNFLFERYEYIVEPKYSNNINKYYDWYIPELNLYIELDGGIRPQITKEKILINKQLNRNCLFIKTDDIYNKKKLKEFMKL